jgi:hypothetical protein
MSKQIDPTFKLACGAIVAGLLIACGSALHSARGLQTQIAAAIPVIQR